MSLFPRGDFAPLFRLLDDYDVHRSSSPKSGYTQAIRAYQPRFDVKELKDAYELHGELPGINQKDINIEFSDDQTIVIRGRTERQYTSGTPPAGLESSTPPAAHLTEAGEPDEAVDTPTNNNYHKATVDEEDGATTGTAASEGVATPTTETETAVEKHASSDAVQQQQQQQQQQQKKEQSRYWISERSVGEFHRSFAFPSRVDQDAVTASLKNGILNIVVPKAAPPKSRRVNIE